MNYCGYDEYLAKFDSDSDDDDDDPVIKQLKYNAYFEDNEEPGWVIVLPGFKPYRYNIQPVVEPVIKERVVRDPGLQHHDEIVNSMKDMALTLSGKNFHSNDKIRTPPINDVPKQRSTAGEIYRYNEPHIYEYRGIVEDAHKHNKKIKDSGNNNKTMPTHNHATKVSPRIGQRKCGEFFVL